MATITATDLGPFVYLFLLAYAVLGGVVFARWQRRTGHLPSLRVNPDIWLPSLLPQLIAVEAWVLIGAGVLAFLLTSTSPLFAGHADAITIVVGFIGVAVVFALLDAAVVVRAHEVARRQADAHQNDPI